jgi:hypothetical protein
VFAAYQRAFGIYALFLGLTIFWGCLEKRRLVLGLQCFTRGFLARRKVIASQYKRIQFSHVHHKGSVFAANKSCIASSAQCARVFGTQTVSYSVFKFFLVPTVHVPSTKKGLPSAAALCCFFSVQLAHLLQTEFFRGCDSNEQLFAPRALGAGGKRACCFIRSATRSLCSKNTIGGAWPKSSSR